MAERGRRYLMKIGSIASSRFALLAHFAVRVVCNGK